MNPMQALRQMGLSLEGLPPILQAVEAPPTPAEADLAQIEWNIVKPLSTAKIDGKDIEAPFLERKLEDVRAGQGITMLLPIAFEEGLGHQIDYKVTIPDKAGVVTYGDTLRAIEKFYASPVDEKIRAEINKEDIKDMAKWEYVARAFAGIDTITVKDLFHPLRGYFDTHDRGGDHARPIVKLGAGEWQLYIGQIDPEDPSEALNAQDVDDGGEGDVWTYALSDGKLVIEDGVENAAGEMAEKRFYLHNITGQPMTLDEILHVVGRL